MNQGASLFCNVQGLLKDSHNAFDCRPIEMDHGAKLKSAGHECRTSWEEARQVKSSVERKVKRFEQKRSGNPLSCVDAPMKSEAPSSVLAQENDGIGASNEDPAQVATGSRHKTRCG